jgi:hypothetical protein
MKKNAFTIREALVLALVLFAALLPLAAQMSVRVDNTTKTINEPTNSTFWSANNPPLSALTNALGGTNAPTVRDVIGAVATTNGTATNLTLNGTTTFGNSTQARSALGLGTAATSNSTAFVATTNGTATNLTLNGSVTVNTNLVFEGATVDSNKTTLAITDPTGNRTITAPDLSGTILLDTTLPTYYRVIGSDQTYTSTNTTNTPISFTLPAGTYMLQSTLIFTTNSPTAGVNANFAISSGDTGAAGTMVFINGGAVFQPRGNTVINGGNIIAVGLDPSATLTQGAIVCQSMGVFTLSGQRTIFLSASQRTNSDAVNPLTLKANSWIFVRRIQ